MRKLLFGVFFCVLSLFSKAQDTVSVPVVPDTVSLASGVSYVYSSLFDGTSPADSLMPWPQRVKSRLDSLMSDELLSTSQLGMCVYDITADSLLYGHNMQQTLRPASTEKLLTAITALHVLGGSFRFVTSLYVDGEVRDSVLYGNVYIKGGMDPAFGHDDMRAFANSLIEKGIYRIDGEIVADISFKDTLRWGNGWCWDDEMERLTPLLYNGKDCFMAEFFSALQDDSIKSCGTFSYGVTPHEGEVFCLVSRYHTIDQILMPMMKESDNMYAEALFYQIGAGKGNDYATAEHSAARIKELINRIGLDASRYRIADGSGLSLYNYSSPELLVAMLRYAHSRTNIFEHLYYSLPVAGVDGTLSRRMLRTSAESNVYAKTGTLEGVSTLAGYAWSRDRHLLAFAIMNQGILRTRHAHAFQNKVCRILTE